MRKLVKILLVALLFCATSCSSAKRYVAYTAYPIGYLLERIGGDKIETISIQNNNLIQTANIVDNYQEILEDSSYLFYLGGIEPYLELYKSEIDKIGVQQIDLSNLNAIYDFKRYTLVTVNGVETYVESPYYDGEVFNMIDTNELDLSIWIDPIGMLSMANDVYTTLASNYVEQAASFRANYEQLEAELIALDASYANLANTLKNNNQVIKFVSMTPNFGSWQKAYGFNIYPVCLSKYGALPSEAELEIIKERIVADGVQYIAYEPNMTAEMADLFDELVSELGLTRINLYNISSLTASQINENKDYMSLMYENLSVLENIASEQIQSAEAESEEMVLEENEGVLTDE